MTQAIIFTNDNGGVSVCIPTGELSIEAVKEKDTPAGSLIVNTSDLPTANDFFDAWELVDGKVEVSLAKATEITKKRLRAEREPLLQAQDVAFQRALEEGTDTTAIVAEKNRLRNITNFSATTLEELRSLKAEKEVIAPVVVEEVVETVEEVTPVEEVVEPVVEVTPVVEEPTQTEV